MLNRLINNAFGAIIAHFLKQRIRQGSIKAVKAYITTVKFARLAAMGLFGVGAISAILIAGIVLTVVGIVGLLPITPTAAAVTILVIGLIMAIGTSVGLAIGFSQKRWLELSKSYEMMEAALGPWQGVLPPNPMEVVKGNTPPGSKAAVREALERDKELQQVKDRPSAPPPPPERERPMDLTPSMAH